MYSQHTERVGPGDGLAGTHKETAVLAGPGKQLLCLGAGDVAMVPPRDHGRHGSPGLGQQPLPGRTHQWST